MALDRFLVYGDYYHKLRDSLASAILSENMDDLIASLEVTYKPLLHLSTSTMKETLMKQVYPHNHKYQQLFRVLLTFTGFL